MDDLDLSIIEILQKNGRTPYTEIAQTLDVSEGTVRNRVARLIEESIIQIVGLVDPIGIGFDAPAIIGVTVHPPELDAAASAIAAFPEVSYLIMVSGEFDLLVEVMCRDREHLARFLNQHLRRVPGVLRSQTFLILHTYKMAYGAQPQPGLLLPAENSEGSPGAG